MDKIPPEIFIKIFCYVRDINDLIATSNTCKRFNEIISNHIKNLSICFGENATKEEIETASREIQANFSSIKSINLQVTQDVWLEEKTKFIETYSENITQLTIKHMSFLNTIFDLRTFHNLAKLHVDKCDLTSSSRELIDFILQGCINLKHLCISSCDGLDVDSLSNLGKQLNQTKIETFELLPSFAYYDIPGNGGDYWRIENLKTLSVRSSNNEVVVMKKGFVRKMIGRDVCENLTKLELAAEINYGENLVPLIANNFPNLITLVLSRGASAITNQDFVTICNRLKNLKKLEFHFLNDDKDLKMQLLKRNLSIEELTLGLTNDFSIDNFKAIQKCLSSLKNLSVIHYNFKSSTSQEYFQKISKIFPNNLVQFQRTGQKSPTSNCPN
jgi:hypothetical protein